MNVADYLRINQSLIRVLENLAIYFIVVHILGCFFQRCAKFGLPLFRMDPILDRNMFEDYDDDGECERTRGGDRACPSEPTAT